MTYGYNIFKYLSYITLLTNKGNLQMQAHNYLNLFFLTCLKLNSNPTFMSILYIQRK